MEFALLTGLVTVKQQVRVSRFYRRGIAHAGDIFRFHHDRNCGLAGISAVSGDDAAM
ncbi:hypothetical protein U1701_07485 [Sphingomonas sp. PB2P19]|uniref:hypothetical protein n=1 Tax=Sphingomonas rhamnosi TaxID=3096156 RepID=UPI002FC9F21C